MPKKLSASALAAYRHDGYYFPVPVLSPKEVSYFRGCLAAALAMKQRAAQFLFQELDGARERGLRNVALFRGGARGMGWGRFALRSGTSASPAVYQK